MSAIASLLSLTYSIAIEAVVWAVLVPVMLARIAARRASAISLKQRLWGARCPPSERILVHAVSAGEMNAAGPLVARLGPTRVLLSTGTDAGMIVARQLMATYPHVEAASFLPWDRARVAVWLERVRPRAVIITETEIWPNLFIGCRKLHVPLFIVNGRLRSQDVRRYRLAGPFFRRVLGCVAWIGVQDARARDGFVAIGAPVERIEVTGDLKIDAVPWVRELPPAVARGLDGFVLVAGSTHAPEEAFLVECVKQLRRVHPDVRLVVAPRNIQRARAVARLAASESLTTVTFSDLLEEPQHAVSWDVMVVDEYGWLKTLYGRAAAVFLGGTLAPIGGHNVAEAAALSRPVIVGPHIDGIASMVELLAAQGGIVRLPPDPSPASFVAACEALLGDPERARQVGTVARDVCRRASGAADRCRRAIAARMKEEAEVR